MDMGPNGTGSLPFRLFDTYEAIITDPVSSTIQFEVSLRQTSSPAQCFMLCKLS
jgi:hypothetical protein